MRGRSYSFSPSPPRSYGRRGRSPSPRGIYGGHRRDLPASLLVRNLRRDCREPRGFGFVQYVDPEDAAEAKHQMDGQILLGRLLTVVFAEKNRKKPAEMRARERTRSRSYDYRSPPRYSHNYYSRSPSPRYSRSRRYSRSQSRSCSYHSLSPRRQDYSSRSVSPRYGRYYRSYSRSPSYSRSRSRSEDYVRKPSHRERSQSVS